MARSSGTAASTSAATIRSVASAPAAGPPARPVLQALAAAAHGHSKAGSSVEALAQRHSRS
eukprot:6120275-Alexandrium_andersonii.AAC.1